MKPNTLVRLPDGRLGRIVYHNLDGYGIKWGIRRWSEDDLPEPDAMLRDLYPSSEYECVGGIYEVIPDDEDAIRQAVAGEEVKGSSVIRPAPSQPEPEASATSLSIARGIGWAAVLILYTAGIMLATMAATAIYFEIQQTPEQAAFERLMDQPLWLELGPPAEVCGSWPRDYPAQARIACARVGQP